MVGITLFVPHKAEKKAVSSLLSNSANRDIEVLKSCIPPTHKLEKILRRVTSRHPAGLAVSGIVTDALLDQHFSFHSKADAAATYSFHIWGYSKMMFETAKK